MAKQNNSDLHDDTERALTQVLQAEEAAKNAVVDCEAEANRIVVEARSQARRIAERADARISTLEGRCDRLADARIDELMREDAARAAKALPLVQNPQDLQRAVDALAADLTEAGSSKPQPT